jgi:hypothetical protein
MLFFVLPSLRGFNKSHENDGQDVEGVNRLKDDCVPLDVLLKLYILIIDLVGILELDI